MDIKELRARLCHLTPAACIDACDQLLATERLGQEEWALVMNLKAYSLRQPSVGRYGDALAVARTALGGSMSEERRAFILEVEAQSLHDLGLIDEIGSVLSAMDQIALPATVRAHKLMLEGFILGLDNDLRTFDKLSAAEAIFLQLKNPYTVAWCQVTAASMAMLMARFSLARSYAERVAYDPFFPVARLLEAEADCWQDDIDRSNLLVNDVLAGRFGVLERRHFCRAHYVQALLNNRAGNLLEAARLIRVAARELRGEERTEPELARSITHLRANFGKGREWRCLSALSS